MTWYLLGSAWLVVVPIVAAYQPVGDVWAVWKEKSHGARAYMHGMNGTDVRRRCEVCHRRHWFLYYPGRRYVCARCQDEAQIKAWIL